MKLYFVTPAWQRKGLSAVVFDQRLDVIRVLRDQGLDARCVVIADDANAQLAEERGFDVIVRPNDGLSDRFNDGIEFAGRAGADWIVPIGSDSWIDPAYFASLHSATVRTSELYCHVTAKRLGQARIRNRPGVGPYVFPRWTLEPSGFRPAKPGLMRSVDSSTITGIEIATGPLPFRRIHLHPYQYIGFRLAPFITSYDGLMAKWGVREHKDPWAILAQHYPQLLVNRAREVLTRQAVPA